MPENQFLAFVEKAGMTGNKIIYRFYFTEAPDVVWGENWNIVPCGIVPSLTPDLQTLSYEGRVISENNYRIAKENTCFSMQDCIDGIIALFFSNPSDSDEIVLRFGEKLEDVEEKLKKCGLSLEEFKKVHQDKENEIVDATLSALDAANEEEEGGPFDDEY